MPLKRSKTTTGTLGPLSTTPAATDSVLLNGMLQGAEPEGEYAFRKIKITNLDLRWWHRNTGSGGANAISGYRYSVAVVYDRRPPESATLPTWNEVFASNEPLDFQKVGNSGRFQVVYRAFGGLGPGVSRTNANATTSLTNIGTVYDTVYKKPNLEVRYDDKDSATQAGIGTGSLFMIARVEYDGGSDPTNSGDKPDLDYSVRIKYVDLNK